MTHCHIGETDRLSKCAGGAGGSSGADELALPGQAKETGGADAARRDQRKS